MMKKLVIGVLTVATVLGGIGVINHGYAAEGNKSVSQSKKVIGMEKAKKIALKKVNGTIESIELDGRVYEVDVDKGHKEYDIDINAYTGEIVRFKEDQRDYDDDDDYVTSNEPIIKEEEAVAIAKREVNGEVKEINLDTDDGHYEYEIELRTGRDDVEVTIDAVTGAVLEIDN